MARYLPARPIATGADAGTAPVDEPDDDALVARIRLGEAAAFETLYRRYYAPLSRFATATTGSAATAEEIVQDVFLGLWRRRTEWQVDHGAAVYLYGAVRNRMLNLKRQVNIAERFRGQAVQDAASFPVLQVVQKTPEASLDASELSAAIQAALNRLSEREQTALRLRWVEELTYGQLGRLFGMTEEGARLLVHRAERSVRLAVRDKVR